VCARLRVRTGWMGAKPLVVGDVGREPMGDVGCEAVIVGSVWGREEAAEDGIGRTVSLGAGAGCGTGKPTGSTCPAPPDGPGSGGDASGILSNAGARTGVGKWTRSSRTASSE
jgi:hypothetical protein